ncbi:MULTISPECIES: HTH domain-containing protein [Haloarcula]|uniref:HTH domain-containing protein n=1 Tax=Haloarcula TaxID=2237 RepID=UPI0023EAF981|nr:HTH domain-containing protein [Halomicroarcula sp. XH51]
MSNSEYPGHRRAVFFVRADLPAPSARRRSALEGTLRNLVDAGVLDDVETVDWDKRVCADGPAETAEEIRYEEFREWAEQANVSLTPCFDTRACYSTTTGERETHLVMPTMCLAVYEDDELVRVAPHATGGGTESVTECVARLSSRTDLLREEATRVTMAD